MGPGEGKEAMDEDRFYEEVAEIIGAEHHGEAFLYANRTRWNNRRAGRGRYPGYGIVRLFGDSVHIALNRPVAINAVVSGRDAALDLLRSKTADKEGSS